MKFGIRGKLMIVLAAAVANVGVVGAVSAIYLNRTVKTYGHVVDVNMRILRALNEARNAQRDVVILASNIVSSSKAVEDADKIKADFDKGVKKYEEATRAYEALPAVEGEAAIREAVTRGWKLFVEPAARVVEISDSAKPADLAERARIATHELNDGRKAFRDSFAALTEFHDAESRKWSEQASAIAAFAKNVLIFATLIGGIFVLAFGAKISGSLTAILSAISARITEASGSTVNASQQISEASQQLASSSTEQASSLQQTASSMEQISAMVNKNAESAQKTRDVSEDSQKQAVEGREVVKSMVESIDKINQSNSQVGARMEASNREMAEIVKVIAEIENKTKVINDIVFQTKLLSFNASVEAARAGEHGKGFAVVAEEVGNLARMSGEAAQSISGILQESTRRVQSIIQQSSSQVEALLSENREKITAGIEIAQRCRAVLENIVANATNMSGMASDIAMASNEQSQGVREVNSAVSQLDIVVQQSNSASQGLSSASQALLGQTESLNSVARELFSVVNGGEQEFKKAA